MSVWPWTKSDLTAQEYVLPVSEKNPSDHALIEATKNGDEAAFALSSAGIATR